MLVTLNMLNLSMNFSAHRHDNNNALSFDPTIH